MDDESLEDTLLLVERQGGGAHAKARRGVWLIIDLSAFRGDGSVLSAEVGYSAGATFPSGTPLLTDADGRALLDANGNPTPLPPGYDGLKEGNVRDELLRLDWKVKGARLAKEWDIRGAADRLSLRQEIEDVLATIGPNDDLRLTYRAPGADGGFGQAGCFFAAIAAAVGCLIGIAVVLIAQGHADPGVAAVGFVAGSLIGFFIGLLAVGIALRVRRLLPKAEDVGALVLIGTSAVVALLVTVRLSLISGTGRSVG